MKQIEPDKINARLIELGFTLSQSKTSFGIRPEWGEHICGNTNVILKRNGTVIYDGLYSRGIGHFDGVPTEPVKPSNIWNIEEHGAYLQTYTKELARFKEICPRFRNKAFMHLRSHKSKFPELHEEYLKLFNKAWKTKPTKVEEDMCYPGRQRDTIKWYELAILHHQQSIEEQEAYIKDHASWVREIKMTTTSKNVELHEIVWSSLMNMTDESFEDWCFELGYDEDSRKAYATWEQCSETGENFKTSGLTDEQINELQELFQDY